MTPLWVTYYRGPDLLTGPPLARTKATVAAGKSQELLQELLQELPQVTRRLEVIADRLHRFRIASVG